MHKIIHFTPCNQRCLHSCMVVKLDLQIYVTGSARVTPVSSVLPSATMVKIEVESSIKKPASQRTSSTSVVWCSQSFYALAIIWRRSQLFGGTRCKKLKLQQLECIYCLKLLESHGLLPITLIVHYKYLCNWLWSYHQQRF